MTAMYRIFYAILTAGGLGGALFAAWANLWGKFPENFWWFFGLSALVGLVYGFVNYIFIKWVLRIFVGKFHTLERVLVGTDPQKLPNVFLSNEIDELEASAVRISDEFNKLLAAQRQATGTGSRSGLRSRGSGSS